MICILCVCLFEIHVLHALMGLEIAISTVESFFSDPGLSNKLVSFTCRCQVYLSENSTNQP